MGSGLRADWDDAICGEMYGNIGAGESAVECDRVEFSSLCVGETAYVFWGKNRVLDDQKYPH